MKDEKLAKMMTKCRRIDALVEIEEFTTYPVPQENIKTTLDRYICDTECDPKIREIKRNYGKEHMKKAWAEALTKGAGWQDYAYRAPEIIVICSYNNVKYFPSVSGNKIVLSDNEQKVTTKMIASEINPESDIKYMYDGKELTLTAVYAPDTENIVLTFG